MKAHERTTSILFQPREDSGIDAADVIGRDKTSSENMFMSWAVVECWVVKLKLFSFIWFVDWRVEELCEFGAQRTAGHGSFVMLPDQLRAEQGRDAALTDRLSWQTPLSSMTGLKCVGTDSSTLVVAAKYIGISIPPSSRMQTALNAVGTICAKSNVVQKERRA